MNKARKGDRLDAPIRSTKTGKPKRLSVPVELQEWIERHVPAERRVGGGPLFTVPWSGRGICHQGRWSGTSLRRTGRGAEEMRGRNGSKNRSASEELMVEAAGIETRVRFDDFKNLRASQVPPADP